MDVQAKVSISIFVHFQTHTQVGLRCGEAKVNYCEVPGVSFLECFQDYLFSAYGCVRIHLMFQVSALLIVSKPRFQHLRALKRAVLSACSPYKIRDVSGFGSPGCAKT